MDIAGASSAIQAFQYAPRAQAAQDAQTTQGVPSVGEPEVGSNESGGNQLAAPPRETGRGQLLDISA